VVFHRQRHRGCGLACREDQCAPLGWLRQMRGNKLKRIRRGDRGTEAGFEKFPRRQPKLSLVVVLPGR
jgi:hypothetical protein